MSDRNIAKTDNIKNFDISNSILSSVYSKCFDGIVFPSTPLSTFQFISDDLLTLPNIVVKDGITELKNSLNTSIPSPTGMATVFSPSSKSSHADISYNYEGDTAEVNASSNTHIMRDGNLRNSDLTRDVMISLLQTQIGQVFDKWQDRYGIYGISSLTTTKSHLLKGLDLLKGYHYDDIFDMTSARVSMASSQDLYSDDPSAIESYGSSEVGNLQSDDTIATEIMNNFRFMYVYATQAYSQASSVEIKSIAMKLRVLPLLHLNYYFHESLQNESLKCISSIISNMWRDYLSCNEVQNILKNEFDSSNSLLTLYSLTSNESKRRGVMSHIASAKSLVEEILYMRPIVSVMVNQSVSAAELHSCKLNPYILQSHTSSVIALVTLNEFLISSGESVKVWDISKHPYNDPIATLSGYQSPVHVLAVSGSYLYAGSEDSNIYVYDFSQSNYSHPIRVLSGHTECVTALTISSGHLFSGAKDNSIRIWDLHSEEGDNACSGLLLGHDNWINTLTVCDGLLCSGSEDKTLKIWDISSMPIASSPLGSINFGSYGVHDLVFSGGLLFSASGGRAIHVWDITMNPLPTEPLATLRGHSDWVYSLAVSGGTLFSGSLDNNICLWDITGDPILPTPVSTIAGHTSGVFALTVCNGKLFSGSVDKTIHMRFI